MLNFVPLFGFYKVFDDSFRVNSLVYMQTDVLDFEVHSLRFARPTEERVNMRVVFIFSFAVQFVGGAGDQTHLRIIFSLFPGVLIGINRNVFFSLSSRHNKPPKYLIFRYFVGAEFISARLYIRWETSSHPTVFYVECGSISYRSVYCASCTCALHILVKHTYLPLHSGFPIETFGNDNYESLCGMR